MIEVPYWAWIKAQEEITQALHDHRSDDELKFSYPLLQDILPLCRCVIGGPETGNGAGLSADRSRAGLFPRQAQDLYDGDPCRRQRARHAFRCRSR